MEPPVALAVLLVLVCAEQASTSFGLPPFFTNEPRDTIIYRINLVLSCAAQGDPSPTITWYRGNPPSIVSDGYVVNGSLVIPNVVEGVDASRGGIPYHCRATSSGFGTIRSKTAFVYYAFFDGFQDRDSIITYNVNIPAIPADRDNVALYCNISGSNPPPAILWVDDLNQTVPSDGDMFLYLDAGRYLAIININAETAQRAFHCRVTNVLGIMTVDSPTQYRFNTSATSRSGLIIYKPFQDVMVYEGDTNLNFSIVAASSDPIIVDYAIFYLPPGSQPLGGMSKQNTILGLLPGPVSMNNSGTIVRCRVFTSMSALSYYANITVLARANLNMTSSPADSLDNLVGTNISFMCGARGVNLMTRWYKNGEEVIPSPRVVTSGFSMTIYGLLERDSGMYQCSVSNGTSSVWRQWRVVVREPKIVAKPIEESVVVVKEGTGVTITMQVMSYPPPHHVQWYMNGSLVTSSALYLISNISVANESTNPITYSASLTISSVNLTTIGFYSASFYGYVGVANNSAIFVTPPVPAHIIGLSAPVCLEAGKSVQLVCEVYGYPTPTVHFFKSGSSILYDGRIYATVNILTISDVQSDDSGVYSCSADNGGDIDHSNCYELLYCSVVSKNVSKSMNSSNVAWSTSPIMISVVVISLVVAVVVTMVTVAIVMTWCCRRLNSKHSSVDINEHYKDGKNPYNLSHHESSVELLNHQPAAEAIVPTGIYETVCPSLKKQCAKTNETCDVPQLPQHGSTTAVKMINVTYSVPDMSMKKKGQDPSTIVRTKAPMGDFYTVPDKKRVDASIGQEQSERQTLSGSACTASHSNAKLQPDQDNVSQAPASPIKNTTPIKHQTITSQTGQAYTIQIIDSDSRTGKEIIA